MTWHRVPYVLCKDGLCKALLQRTVSPWSYRDNSSSLAPALLTVLAVLLLECVLNGSHWLLTGGRLDERHRAAAVIISAMVLFPLFLYHFWNSDGEYTLSEAAFADRVTTGHAFLLLGAIGAFLCAKHCLDL